MTSDPGGSLGAAPRARRRWWSALPPPPTKPISARRAYTEVLLLFAAAFGSGVIAAADSVAGRTVPNPGGSWTLYGPAAVGEVGAAAITAVAVILLAARRGITPRALGLSWRPGTDGAAQRYGAGRAVRVIGWAVLAIVLGGVINSALASGHFPKPHEPGLASFAYGVAGALNAGVVEELVVLAFTISTLRQARRPLPEIVLVALLLRCSYHIYYGPGVLGIAVWAALFIWIYLRTRQLLPLILVHFGWDVLGSLTPSFPNAPKAVLGLAGLGILVLLGALYLTALISWLIERSELAAATRPPGPPGPPWTGAYPSPPSG
jgi:Type II CAAX prenyl endopeptidase Rce1-like